MQITLKQLNTHLKRPLLPFYLISGDEPLLIQEARNAIFSVAKIQGFSEKEICYSETDDHTKTVIAHIYNQSLFSEKKLIDIRNPQAKFDAAMIDFFLSYFAHPVNDRMMIVSTDKLSSAQQKSVWFELIKKQGVYVPIWPIRSEALPTWIMERAKQFQISLPLDVAKVLAYFSEGNLLSAQQALEKLQLLYPNATISREQLLTVLSEHARFNVFDLSESLLQGNTKKIIRMIKRLQETGEEPTFVLWAICRQLRENSASSHIKKALQCAAQVDEIIKGARIGDVWQALLELTVVSVGKTSALTDHSHF